MVFKKRPIAAPDTLGERLRQLREELKLTPEDLGRKIHVAAKYVLAIETSRYQDLPGSIYARNFVRQYVVFVNLNEAPAMDRFEQEYALMTTIKSHSRPILPQVTRQRTFWLRRHGRLLASVIAIVIVGIYIIWQINHLLQPPVLTISAPSGNVLVHETFVTVTGQTVSDATVTINNLEVDVDRNGKFSETIDLQPGVNTIVVSSVRKRGKANTVTRQVLVELPTNLPPPVPIVPAPGP